MEADARFSGQSEGIELFSAEVVRPAIIELVLDFEKKSGHKVLTKFDLNPIVKKRIDQGERFDVVIINPWMIDDLIEQKKVTAATRVGFGRVEMGIAVRADTKPPLWASVDDFKQTLVNAKSIAYAAEGTSGKTFEGVLQKLGIFQAISDRLKPVAGGQTAISVANGEAQIGVIPVSTILEAPGVTLAGTFPSELHTSIDLSGGLSTEARHPAASHALLEFLIGPSADAILSAKGISRLKR